MFYVLLREHLGLEGEAGLVLGKGDISCQPELLVCVSDGIPLGLKQAADDLSVTRYLTDGRDGLAGDDQFHADALVVELQVGGGLGREASGSVF